jgi:MFS family permease
MTSWLFKFRREMSPRWAVVCNISSLATVTAASSAPSPLYRIYQDQWGFHPIVLTVIFAAYALSFLVSLLTVGSLSDYVGRKPVILTALVFNALAMCIFITAESASVLIVARPIADQCHDTRRNSFRSDACGSSGYVCSGTPATCVHCSIVGFCFAGDIGAMVA